MKEIILSGNLIINNQKEIYLLFRKKHHFYETPGGKVKPEECSHQYPTRQELQTTAQRELLEEVKGIEEISSMEYFAKVKLHFLDGRKAIAHKFITKVKGFLSPQEDIFDQKKSGYLPLSQLENYPLSPDLKLLLPKIKKYFSL